jgi:hypothetical protein
VFIDASVPNTLSAGGLQKEHPPGTLYVPVKRVPVTLMSIAGKFERFVGSIVKVPVKVLLLVAPKTAVVVPMSYVIALAGVQHKDDATAMRPRDRMSILTLSARPEAKSGRARYVDCLPTDGTGCRLLNGDFGRVAVLLAAYRGNRPACPYVNENCARFVRNTSAKIAQKSKNMQWPVLSLRPSVAAMHAPLPGRVKNGNTRCEQMFSALPPKADIRHPLYRDSDYSGYAGYFKITEITRITGVAIELGWRLCMSWYGVIADPWLYYLAAGEHFTKQNSYVFDLCPDCFRDCSWREFVTSLFQRRNNLAPLIGFADFVGITKD